MKPLTTPNPFYAQTPNRKPRTLKVVLRCKSGIDAKNIRLCVIDMFKEFRIPKTEYEIEIG